jgi:hypothetical protein
MPSEDDQPQPIVSAKRRKLQAKLHQFKEARRRKSLPSLQFKNIGNGCGKCHFVKKNHGKTCTREPCPWPKGKCNYGGGPAKYHGKEMLAEIELQELDDFEKLHPPEPSQVLPPRDILITGAVRCSVRRCKS